MVFQVNMFNINDPASFLHLLIMHSIPYIVNIPYFWGSMGFTVAISMLITASLFDHDIDAIKKFAFSVLAFIMMLFVVTFTRVQYTTVHDISNTTYSRESGFTYAGIATIIMVFLFWEIGILLGLIVLKLQKRLN